MPRIHTAIVLLIALSTSTVLAEVKLPAIFGDNMVLQRDLDVPVWGWADNGENVTVSFAGQTQKTKAGKDGKWRVTLSKLAASSKPQSLKVNSIEVKNVLVGEVWICSGQSNMAWTVTRAANPQEEIAAAKYPNIRFITVPRKTELTPQDDMAATTWQLCSPQTTGNFSAVAYFFGRHLHKELNIPIGLVNTSVGGTPSESWTSRKALEAKSNLKPLLERWDLQVKNFDEAAAKAKFDAAMAKWKEAIKKAKAAKKKAPRRPRPARNPGTSTHRPGNLFNAMVHPLIPFSVRGAIWYQGESNASRAHQYQTVFPTMINDWRARWDREFSFYFVQLANFKDRKDEPGDSDWAELREAQNLTLKRLKNTGQAVIIDIGAAKDIHPKNKQDVGKRLAFWALAKDYGKDIAYSGPVPGNIEYRAGRAVISFNHCDGLSARGGGEVKGFAIAGKDQKFYWARAKIDGSVITLSHPSVNVPVAVRYGWADNPDCNLINSAGLPASPFRTDTWKGVTEGRH